MSQQTPITGSYIWTLEDVKTMQEVLAGRPVTLKGKLVLYAVILVLFVAAMGFISRRNSVDFLSLFTDPLLLAAFLTAIVILYVVIRYSQSTNLKKAFQQSPDSNKRIDVVFGEDEIVMTAEGIYESKWKWNTVKQVQRNPKGFCLFMGEQTGIWIPIRAFQSQADADALTKRVREMPFLKYRELA